MAVIRQGLRGSNSTSNDTRKASSSPGSSNSSVGKVFAIVTAENTPTPAMYEKAGGVSGIGSVFYLGYESSKQINGDLSDNFLNTCLIAKPIQPNVTYYPLIGELINLYSAPAPASQITKKGTKTTTYWAGPINLWNDSQSNSQTTLSNAPLGKTFTETANNKNLLSYEGDYILFGRKSNSVRFGSTVRSFSNPNTPNGNGWSSVGNNGDPILLITNGHAYTSSSALLYVERINDDASSVYLTSTQAVNLIPDKNSGLNPFTNPISVNTYNGSQVIANGDRIVLNSKKDEVMLFAKTNIELNTQNIINLNADNRIHLNSSKIYLGPATVKGTINNLPGEPILLGYQTMDLLSEILSVLNEFSNTISPTIGAPQGMIVASIKSAADRLADKTEKLLDRLEPGAKNYIASTKIYIS
jgi:hypothetical protein